MDTIIPKKQCSICKVPQPLTDFYKNKSRPDKHRRECIKCSKVLEANRKRPNDITRGMRAVGFNREAYNKVWEQQGGKCAMCDKPETGKNQWGVKRLAVDHDHATGKFRGLLCYSCNTRLAILEDKEFVKAASEYLSQHS